jgi:integrase
MARKASVRYWKSRGGYCCWIKGKQEVLAVGPDDFPDGPTYKAAFDRYTGLMALANAGAAKDENTIRVVCEKYLDHLEMHNKKRPATIDIRKRFLTYFIEGGHRETKVKDLTPYLVYEFCNRMREDSGRENRRTKMRYKWSDGSVRGLLVSLGASLNWAARSGLITRNPLKGIEVPEARSRGRDLILEKEEQQRIFHLASPAFRLLLEALENTGARPSEIRNAKASDFDPKLGALVYHPDRRRKDGEASHKTGRKNKERVVRFTGPMLEKVKELVQQHPTGYLFRPRVMNGQKRRTPDHWTQEAMRLSLWKIRKKLKLDKPLCAYSYRHTYAARMVEAGMSFDVLAALMGTSAKMIRDHYGHLAENEDFLRAQAEKFSPKASRESGDSPSAGPGANVGPSEPGR